MPKARTKGNFLNGNIIGLDIKYGLFFSCFVDDIYLLFYYGHRLKGDKMFTLRGLIFTRMLYTYTEIFLFIVLNVLTSNKNTIY